MYTSKAAGRGGALPKSLSSAQKITVNERRPSLEGSARAGEAIAAQSRALREQTDGTTAQITHGGGGNALGFMCQALKETKIEHVSVDRVEVNRAPGDPITVELEVDPATTYVAIVNAERFQPGTEKPLLLGVLVREGADPRALDLSGFARAKGDPFRTMKKDQTRVTFRSADDSAFAFGTPIVQISYDANAKEANRSARTRPSNTLTEHILRGNDHREVRTAGDVLDRTPVQALLDHLRLGLVDAPPAWWPGDKLGEPRLSVEAERGLVRQPGAELEITTKKREPNLFTWDRAERWSTVGSPIRGSVAATDASFAGNAPAKGEPSLVLDFDRDVLDLAFHVKTQSNSRRGEERFDTSTTRTSARQLLQEQWRAVTVGGKRPAHETATNPPEVTVTRALESFALELPAGWIQGPVSGWTVDAGYTGLDGLYHSLARRTLTGASDAQCFRFDFETMPANTPLELRVHDPRGVPAHRAVFTP